MVMVMVCCGRCRWSVWWWWISVDGTYTYLTRRMYVVATWQKLAGRITRFLLTRGDKNIFFPPNLFLAVSFFPPYLSFTRVSFFPRYYHHLSSSRIFSRHIFLPSTSTSTSTCFFPRYLSFLPFLNLFPPYLLSFSYSREE